jgi:hypothetical protein
MHSSESFGRLSNVPTSTRAKHQYLYGQANNVPGRTNGILMSDIRRDQLAAKMLVCSYTARNLLERIGALEADTGLTSEEKFAQIKIIREEISKVGTEIDSIKKEITLLNAYSVN